MGVRFDEDFIIHDAYYYKMVDAGYAATKMNGKYCLFNHSLRKDWWHEIGEFDTLDELNRMLLVLVGGE